MSKDATKIYSTWFSVAPRGYCERSFREVPASDRNGAESDECWEDGFAGEEELSFWLSSDVRSDSWMGGCGDFGGRDICEGDREGGNEDSEVRRVFEGGAPEPLEPLS